MRAFRNLLLLAVLALVAAAAWLYWFATHPVELPRTPFEFTVKSGASVKSVSRKLADEGLFAEGESFWVIARILGKSGAIQAGTYRLDRAMTPLEILDKLKRGDVVLAEILFVEGTTYRQWRAQLAANPNVKQTLAGRPEDEIRAALGITEASPEGWLFPDTYRFAPGTSDLDLLRRAHNAMKRRLNEGWTGRDRSEIKRLILTASGGPFREFSAEALDAVDAAAALQHPTWRMGRKITIDSATLMNKGLEVIEAHWLFGVSADQIDVVIHPQSIVHSLVELIDGSIIAQLGITDMRLPIQYACSYPERWEARSLPTLDLLHAGRLEFHAPARDRFPCLDLAYRALRTGGTLPVVLNAANEVAVEYFLDGKLGFTAISRVIQETMDAHVVEEVTTLDVVRRVDRWSRECARHTAQALELNA